MRNEITFISKLNLSRFTNFCCIVLNYVWLKLFKREICISIPFSLTIEPTNACNLKCPQCLTGLSKYKDQGYMSLEFFKRLIDTYSKKVMMVQLHFRGEPMLHKDLFEMISYAASRNMYLTLSTNGHFISENVEQILNSGLNHINISLDGMSEEVYTQYRKGGNFNKVIEGIKKLAAGKMKKMTENFLLITLQMLITRHTEQEKKRFRTLRKIPGIDACKLKSMQVVDQKTAHLYKPGEKKYQRASRNTRRKICLKTLTTAVFSWDGKLLPCCYDRHEKFILNEIAAIPDMRKMGELMKSFRASLYHNHMPAMCNNCEESADRIYF